MKRSLVLASGLVALLSLLGPANADTARKVFAAGAPGDPKKPARTVEMRMKETDDGRMLYEPNEIQVKRGEQVRFVLKNDGKVDHEFMLDSIANNAKHKAAMQKNPDMEHAESNGKRLAPENNSEVLWRFTKAGTFEFACLIPGHYESGMHGTVVVK